MFTNMAELEKYMYDFANHIVGDPHPRHCKKLKPPTGEKWTFFNLLADTNREIFPIWADWINAYCKFKKLETPENCTIERNPKLHIYWFVKPKIVYEPRYKKMKGAEVIEEGPLAYFVRAYLLISRHCPKQNHTNI